MVRESMPKIHIDDLHVINDGYVHAYKATWQESGIIAILFLDVVEREHFLPGHYRKHAYELVSSTKAVSGRPMGAIQDEQATLILRELRAQMLAAMVAAGWQEVDRTQEEQPIYQYQPTQHPSATLAPGQDQVEALPIGDADVPDLIVASVAIPGEMQADQFQDDLLELKPVEPAKPRSHVVEVIGGSEAKERGQQPAYSREVFTREVTFTCIVCGDTVTQQRYTGHTPLYCSQGCKDERVAEKTRERVAKHRERKKAAIGNMHSQEGVTNV